MVDSAEPVLGLARFLLLSSAPGLTLLSLPVVELIGDGPGDLMIGLSVLPGFLLIGDELGLSLLPGFRLIGVGLGADLVMGLSNVFITWSLTYR